MNFSLTKDGGLLVDVSTHVASPDMCPVTFDVTPEDVDAYFTLNPTAEYPDLGNVVMEAVKEYINDGGFYE